MQQFWSVAVDAPVMEPLTYKIPDSFKPLRGQRVSLPLGMRNAKGVLLGPAEKVPEVKIKDVASVDSEFSPLPDFFLKWLEWVSHYYIYPIGSVVNLAFPALRKTSKETTRKRSPLPQQITKPLPELTQDQSRVLKEILPVSDFKTHLIYGVTGSGKTEVYMRLLDEVLKLGKRGLVLVPEISLTPQLIERFVSRFGEQVAVLHSQLTDRERTNQWWQIVDEKKSILIGARSALFCPIQNLGIIIVDEEHEPSYKQDEKLKYHGRDCAVMLGKFANCPVVLGSATPSLETWKNVLDKKYHLHEMLERVEGRSLPQISFVDLRIEKSVKRDLPNWMSDELFQAISETLEKKEQVALFLNRRGVAPLVLCNACGYSYSCPNCEIKLTLHGKSHLVCHYCDYHENMKDACPDCKEGEVSAIGLGTELLENEASRLFPEAKVARADRDEISNRIELENLIKKMENHEIDILVGTQMIAKGLDFPRLTLVGLVLADIGFNIPDFRATERSFQLVTQVSGRSGRHVSSDQPPGKVIVQAFNPDHPSLIFAQNLGFKEFAKSELENRKSLLYPPFGRLVSLRIQGRDLAKVQNTAKLCAKRASELKALYPVYEKIEVLGPAPAPLSKVRGNFRYHLLLKGSEAKILNTYCRQLIADESWVPSSIRIIADIDPIHLL